MRIPYISKRAFEAEEPIMQVMKSLPLKEGDIALSQGVPFFGPPEEAIMWANASIARNE